MRATAIVLVLVSHAGFWFSNFPSSSASFGLELETVRHLEKIVRTCGSLSGYFGVELFFVLSGFLIGSILLRWLTRSESTMTLGQFWRRRWMRTLPNYFLFLSLNAVTAMWLYHSLPSVWRYISFTQNIFAPPSDFFRESWSLAIEEWFYFIVPLCFVTALKFSKQTFQTSSLLIIAAIIAVVTIARSVYVVLAEPMWLTGVRIIVAYRLDACMFGVLAAWAKQFYPESWRRPHPFLFCCGLAGLIGIVVLAIMLPNDSFFLHTAGFAVTSIGAALLLPTLDSWRNSAGRCRNLITKISIWSYSLYLTNGLVSTFVFQCWRDSGTLLCVVVSLALSVVAAAFVYRFYEKPIMNLRDRTPSQPRTLIGGPPVIAPVQ